MYFRAFLSLFFSSFKTCAILGFLLGVAVALKSIVVWGESFSAILGSFFFAFVASLFGPFLAFPVIFLGTFICVYLAKRPVPRLRDFIISSTLLSSAYGIVLQVLGTYDLALWFIAAGPLVGWFAWRDMPFYLKPHIEKEKGQS